MLNSKNESELAYFVKIDAIEPIIGSDNCECAVVGGWKVMVRNGTFKVGDLAIYFEVDSKVDTTKREFAFLAKRNGKIKTQKYTFGGKGLMYSQGLLMHVNDFVDETGRIPAWLGVRNAIIASGGDIFAGDTRFLTKELGVVYADSEDNTRKASTPDKYKVMAQRNPNLFKNALVKKIMRYKFGRKIMFFFFGKKKDKKNTWPSHIASKTDVERVQNCPWVFQNHKTYVATEKIDGSSCSIMAERKKFGKINYYVCSRNVVFKDENQECFYDNNVYFEAYNKYNLKEIITRILNDYNLPNVALQMEVFGDNIQKRNYSLKKGEHQIRVFHIVSNNIKFSMDEVAKICEKYGLPCVPIVDDNYQLPNTIEELQAFVESEGSRIDGLPREGIVFYDKETGHEYFKFVSPEFLIKYHGG